MGEHLLVGDEGEQARVVAGEADRPATSHTERETGLCEDAVRAIQLIR